MEQPVRMAMDMISSKPFPVHGAGSSADGNTEPSGDRQAEHSQQSTVSECSVYLLRFFGLLQLGFCEIYNTFCGVKL